MKLHLLDRRFDLDFITLARQANIHMQRKQVARCQRVEKWNAPFDRVDLVVLRRHPLEPFRHGAGGGNGMRQLIDKVRRGVKLNELL